MVAIYKGSNGNLNTQINEFLHFYNKVKEYIGNPNFNNALVRKLINNVEARFISLISNALHLEEGGVNEEQRQYDIKWVTASRRELKGILEVLATFRQNNNIHMNDEQKKRMEELKKNLSDENQAFNVKEIKEAHKKAATEAYGKKYGGAATSATGAAAFGFFGGPVVGGITTGVTAAVTFPIACYATYSKAKKAGERAPVDFENETRSHFDYY